MEDDSLKKVKILYDTKCEDLEHEFQNVLDEIYKTAGIISHVQYSTCYWGENCVNYSVMIIWIVF
jgi:hypothetical protein